MIWSMDTLDHQAPHGTIHACQGEAGDGTCLVSRNSGWACKRGESHEGTSPPRAAPAALGFVPVETGACLDGDEANDQEHTVEVCLHDWFSLC